MAPPLNGQISFSFIELRQLMRSFEEYANGSQRSDDHKNAIFELVDHIGGMAIPTLLRQLFQDASSAFWASELLIHLTDGSQDLHHRIAVELLAELQHSALPYSCRVAVAELLTNLGEEVPWPDLCSVHSSLTDLASCIASPAKLARAANSLLCELAAADILEFVEDVSEEQPVVARSLICELLARDSLTTNTRASLQQLAVSTKADSSHAEPWCETPANSTEGAKHPRSAKQGALKTDANSFGTSFLDAISAPRRRGLRIAKHDDGRSALIAYAQCDDASGTYRALCLLIDCRSTLQNCEYLEQVARGTIESLMLRPLAEAGYELSPLAPGTIKQHAIAAAHRRLRMGTPMPRSYYLGRDLMNLSDEHLLGRSPRSRRRTKNAALLARGTELLRSGRAERAIELLIRYANGHPNDSEALATLASCLLEVGETKRARTYLGRASALAPDVGRYHWNRAALAHEEGRIGECYLALKEYLRCNGRDKSQRQLASELIARYGRSTQTERSE